jgi:hypothetical protein
VLVGIPPRTAGVSGGTPCECASGSPRLPYQHHSPEVPRRSSVLTAGVAGAPAHAWVRSRAAWVVRYPFSGRLVVRAAAARYLPGRGQQSLLDGVLRRLEVPEPAGDHAESLRRQLAQQILDLGRRPHRPVRSAARLVTHQSAGSCPSRVASLGAWSITRRTCISGMSAPPWKVIAADTGPSPAPYLAWRPARRTHPWDGAGAPSSTSLAGSPQAQDRTAGQARNLSRIAAKASLIAALSNAAAS